MEISSDAHSRRRAVSVTTMLAFAYVCAFVATLWVPFVVADAARRAPGALERGACVELIGAVDWTLASLLLFNAVNALICVWEIALWVHRENVQRLHEGYIKKFGDKVRGSARETRERVRGTRERETRETRRLTEPNDTDVARAQVLPSPLCLFEDISLSQALSLKYWSIIFAQYASLDPSYVQHTSWSFWIDVGNGFTTLIPTVALSIAVTGFPVVPLIASISPRTLGVVTVVMNYQMLYGTVFYFVNYRHNRYHEGASARSRAVVLFANLVWIIGPSAWIIVGLGFVRSNDLTIAL